MHLASIVTPGPDSTRELEYAVDVDGTRHVLDACVAHGVRRVVVSSSGAAYGYHPDNPAWITEDQPVRGNEEFAYSHHKRLVEEMLAELRTPRARAGGAADRHDPRARASTTRSPRCSSGKRLLKIRGSESPFVFIWDTDVVAMIQQAVTGPVTGVFNVAGDGALTINEIAGAARREAGADRPRAGAADRARGRLAGSASRRTGRSRRSSCSTARCSPTTGSRRSSATPRRDQLARRSRNGVGLAGHTEGGGGRGRGE